jgi:hypothetical protein
MSDNETNPQESSIEKKDDDILNNLFTNLNLGDSDSELSPEDILPENDWNDLFEDLPKIENKNKNKNEGDIPKIIEEEINFDNIKECKNNNIFNHFQSELHIKRLITLYQSSNKECSRNGKLNPEVGSSRENDLKASFLSNEIFTINYNIPNENEEDIIIDNKKISIKHSSDNNTICSGIKITWTVNKESREEFKKNFIFKCDFIIIYVRFNDRILLDKGELEIIYIPMETLINQQNIFNKNKQNIYKFLDGNSRGIEFDKLFFKKIIDESLFHIKIKFNNLICNISNPVIKRLNQIKQIN